MLLNQEDDVLKMINVFEKRKKRTNQLANAVRSERYLDSNRSEDKSSIIESCIVKESLEIVQVNRTVIAPLRVSNINGVVKQVKPVKPVGPVEKEAV